MPDDVDVSNITSQKPELAISFQPLVLVKEQFLFEEPSLRSQESKPLHIFTGRGLSLAMAGGSLSRLLF